MSALKLFSFTHLCPLLLTHCSKNNILNYLLWLMCLELKGRTSLLQKPVKQAEVKFNAKLFILVVTSILIWWVTFCKMVIEWTHQKAVKEHLNQPRKLQKALETWIEARIPGLFSFCLLLRKAMSTPGISFGNRLWEFLLAKFCHLYSFWTVPYWMRGRTHCILEWSSIH